MKEKIMLFVIGVLVGAVISTGAFFVYTKATSCNNNSNNTQMQMPGGTPPSMPNGDNKAPEMPNNKENDNSNENNTQSENNKQNSTQNNS